MTKFVRFSLAVTFLAAFAGCASVPMASADADKAAKQFVAAPNKASIYVYRNEGMGSAIKFGVYLNEQPVGQNAAKTYLQFNVDPGKHKIRGHAENNSEIELDAKAGQTYFIWQEVKMGFGSARNQLQLVDEATGKKGVNQCKLAAAGQ
jgi:hypothetical protein